MNNKTFNGLRYLVFTLIALFVLVSCTTHNPNAINRAQILEDYDEYWDILSENFIYFENLEASNINLENIKNKHRETLDRESVTVSDLENTLDAISSLEFKQVAHHFFYDEELFFKTGNIISCYSKTFNYTDKELERFDAFFNKNSIKFYETKMNEKGQEIKTDCDDINDENIVSDSNLLSIVEESQNTIRIIIPTFSADYHEKSLKVLDEFLINNSDYKNVIFDIRNNPGGSSIYASDVISRFIQQSIEMNNTYVGYGPLTIDYLAPIHENSIIKDNELIFTDIQKIEPNNNNGKDLKLYILVENIYSASHGFVKILENNNLAISIGRRSYADFASNIDPMIISLKNSGLVFGFDNDIEIQKRNKPLDEFYHVPSIEVESYEDSLKKALTIISSAEIED